MPNRTASPAKPKTKSAAKPKSPPKARVAASAPSRRAVVTTRKRVELTRKRDSLMPGPHSAPPPALHAVGAPRAPAAPSGEPIGEGSRAPDFELQDDAQRAVSSAELEGKPYVLYFYPKDDTPGCTTEACGFRDSFNRFKKSGVQIFGVSPDSAASHAKFKAKYELNFPLLSDPDKTLANAYGVWTKKVNYGREYMGIERSTFLIDSSGVVRRAWRKVRVAGHVDAVLAEANKLR